MNGTLEDYVASLRAFHGFDLSYATEGSIIAKCSKCHARIIDGEPRHEVTCQNQMHCCIGCDATIPKKQLYCSECRAKHEGTI